MSQKYFRVSRELTEVVQMITQETGGFQAAARLGQEEQQDLDHLLVEDCSNNLTMK